MFIYNQGYLLKKLANGQIGWDVFTIPGSTYKQSAWLRGSTPAPGVTYKFTHSIGVANLGMPAGVTESVVVVYRCKSVTSSTGLKSWKCGCRTATDCGKWSIESFDICASGRAIIAGGDNTAACCPPGYSVSASKCCDATTHYVEGSTSQCCAPYVFKSETSPTGNLLSYACCSLSTDTVKNAKCCSATKSWVQGDDQTWGCCDTTDGVVENGVCTALPASPAAPPTLVLGQLTAPTIINKDNAEVGTYNYITLKHA